MTGLENGACGRRCVMYIKGITFVTQWLQDSLLDPLAFHSNHKSISPGTSSPVFNSINLLQTRFLFL